MANMYHAKSERNRRATKGARFDLEEERLLAEWIQDVTGEPRFDLSLFEWLNNGQVLCKLVNTIRPNSVKVNRNLAPSTKIENLNTFLLFCETLGVRKEELFEPEDLVEKNNTAKVVQGLYAFSAIIGRIAPEYAGPTLVLPGVFAGYYRSHFKQSAGFDSIHSKFAAFKSVTERPAALAALTPAPQGFMPSMGSFHGGAGMFGGVMVVEEKVEAKKELLPSMGSFHGGAGAFGGVIVITEKVEVKAKPLELGNNFLPSMGSFAGPVGKFGGQLPSPKTKSALGGR